MFPEWVMRLPLNLIYTHSQTFKLDPLLIASICWQESRGFVYAVRFEPNFKYFYRVEHFAKFQRITVETERNLQQHSFGLMQIMGGTVRDLGFDGALPALYKPENNLYWGCKFLAKQRDRWGEGDPLVASYNAGSPRMRDGKFVNQGYVDSVNKYYRELKATNGVN